MQENIEQLDLPEIPPASNEDIVAYLRRSRKIAEIATYAEQEALILKLCEQLGVTVSDEELQAEGDAFRRKHNLLGASETMAWLETQRISLEDWSEGIRISLLKKKLQEHLFGEQLDAHYMNNRDNYKRVALSQIVVSDLTKAKNITQAIREENASFCAFAIEYSLGKQSRENGGYVGIRILSELMSEIVQALKNTQEGQVTDPVQTKLGYHILKVEKWFPAELNQIREQMLEYLFQNWLQNKINSSSANSPTK